MHLLSTAPRASDQLVAALAAAFGLPAGAVAGTEVLERTLAGGDHTPIGQVTPSRRVCEVSLVRDHVILGRAVAKSGLSSRRWRALCAVAEIVQRYALPVPHILALLPEQDLLLMEVARGERLDRGLRSRSGAATAERAGAALAAFHAAPGTGCERLTLDRLLGDLQPAPAAIPGPLGQCAAALVQAIARAPEPLTRLSGLCHRDLHPRQMFDDGRRVMLVDLDLAGRGHPALDLANLDVYLQVRMPRVAASRIPAFLAGYTAVVQTARTSASRQRRSYLPGQDPAAESVYRAFTYLRLAVKAYRTRGTAALPAVGDLVVAGERALQTGGAAA